MAENRSSALPAGSASSGGQANRVIQPAVPSSVEALEQQVLNLTKMMQNLVALHAATFASSMSAAQSASAALAGVPGVPASAAPAAAAAAQVEHDVAMALGPLEEAVKTVISKDKLRGDLLAKMKAESAKLGKSLGNLGSTRAFKKKLDGRLSDLAAGAGPASTFHASAN